MKSGDNSLSSLSLSHGTLSPSFQGNVTEYTAQVGSDVSSITVNPVTSNSKASIESITGNTDLTEGKNVISVTVKAENGNTATYKIILFPGNFRMNPSQRGFPGRILNIRERLAKASCLRTGSLGCIIW